MAFSLCIKCKKRPAMIFISRADEFGLSSQSPGEPQGYCITCAKDLGIAPINEMLQKINLPEEMLDGMGEELMQMMENTESDESGDDAEGFVPGGAATFPFLQQIFGPMESAEQGPEHRDRTGREPAGESPGEKKERTKKRKYLDLYCTNLTARAKGGLLDRIIGRDDELYRVVQILSRRTKNNPCLIGEPGVGKTAIAEGLALKIAQMDVPARLMDKEIHLLDLTALVAGTQFRGQFESRIKGLVDEVRREGNIILFIDEIHNLVGTGDAEGSMNAANILKPALSRGEIQVIGATTFREYRKYIEKDAALERRFQPVTIEEPSVEDAVKVLLGVRDYYQDFHNVIVSDELIRRCVVLSERYITDRFLPDKAIDLLDEACACASLRNKTYDDLIVQKKEIEALSSQEEELEARLENVDYERLAVVKSELARRRAQAQELSGRLNDIHVTDDDLAYVIELWTGIPASKVKESDLKKLSRLETSLKKKIIGQDEAVQQVAAAVRRSRVQISPRRRPASFIFVGPTGVGKTELVKVLAAELFNTPETLIRLDMSEFMEKHSVSRIIGAPPGYVGYDEAGQLTEKVRRKPYSVLLFDEIEKAHPDVLNILLQILDDGRITDAQGRTVNFENTILVMTSNAGSERREGVIGFAKSPEQVSRDKALRALSDFLRPEFLSRVDEVIVFRPLTGADFERIAELMLDELKAPLSDKGITFSYRPEVLKPLAEEAFGGTRGARDLRNLIRRKVEDRIASLLVDRCDDPPRMILLDDENGELKLHSS